MCSFFYCTTNQIELKTAPADFRFPTTNQSRHCFTRYIEFHSCLAAKGEESGECERFAKYYRSLCPGEWVSTMSCLFSCSVSKLKGGMSRGTMEVSQGLFNSTSY
ncbi:hypothetical protein RJ639_014780 [Escallonia herrerae]|uniref:Uncharacterized protein n=1 Tax=Escallonia herrerae TaxID=1293975 RepID=A0AA88VGW0_9ASTE|nr:hypothetical protein RJ639_014780 [Escallonia herrerae]